MASLHLLWAVVYDLSSLFSFSFPDLGQGKELCERERGKGISKTCVVYLRDITCITSITPLSKTQVRLGVLRFLKQTSEALLS
jgi:hypothetical protein